MKVAKLFRKARGVNHWQLIEKWTGNVLAQGSRGYALAWARTNKVKVENEHGPWR